MGSFVVFQEYRKHREVFMRKDKLSLRSMNFATTVVDLVKRLKVCHEYTLSSQIGRSSTSIGTNIREGQYAQNRADFISKLHIALKEANEMEYRLELLYHTKYIEQYEYTQLLNDCDALRAMLIASITTSKVNMAK